MLRLNLPAVEAGNEVGAELSSLLFSILLCHYALSMLPDGAPPQSTRVLIAEAGPWQSFVTSESLSTRPNRMLESQEAGLRSRALPGHSP